MNELEKVGWNLFTAAGATGIIHHHKPTSFLHIIPEMAVGFL